MFPHRSRVTWWWTSKCDGTSVVDLLPNGRNGERERKGEGGGRGGLVIACTVSARYRFRCELGTIWRRFEDDFISARRRPSGMLHGTYVCCARCIAFPHRRSAISRELPWRSFAAAHRTAARRFKWVAQTAPAWVLCARARRNWFKPHYTWTCTREPRRASCTTTHWENRASLSLSLFFSEIHTLFRTWISANNSCQCLKIHRKISSAIITMADWHTHTHTHTWNVHTYNRKLQYFSSTYRSDYLARCISIRPLTSDCWCGEEFVFAPSYLTSLRETAQLRKHLEIFILYSLKFARFHFHLACSLFIPFLDSYLTLTLTCSIYSYLHCDAV